MNLLLLIVWVLAGIVAALLLAGLFLKKTHYVKRGIVVNAPLLTVFPFLRLLRNQDRFNKWASADKKGRVEEFTGTDGTTGFIYSWSGNRSAGAGAKEIMSIVEGKRVETEIRFTKPITVRSSFIMETEALSSNQTKIDFINTGTLPYPLNLMIPLAERNFTKDLDESLAAVKNILETDAEVRMESKT